ncbi:MAG: apolipoprotein N-acyltransferase [Campylobacterales bacterium]|nr:apolipoprotein N-acyltransferase [Campylobacterales bacterium]
MRHHFNTFVLTRGFFIALLGAAFIYLDFAGFSHPMITTLLGMATLYLLLIHTDKVWFWTGFFIGIFWFWWITLSFVHYGFGWAIPIGIVIIALIYAFLFWSAAWVAQKIPLWFHLPHPFWLSLALKAIGIWSLSWVHPLGFDWFKPELIFTQSYLGIHKWQFALVLAALVFSIGYKKWIFLLLILLAYQPHKDTPYQIPSFLQITQTKIPVEEKWDKKFQGMQFEGIFKLIDNAIDANKTLVILPESVFPVFLNYTPELFDRLQQKAQKINIVTGALYWDGEVPHNSTFIFTKDHVQVANKVILVPFGESNPLPDFLSRWVNKIFYDGAVDYIASTKISDYQIGEHTYRNAICFEATSEILYKNDPKEMIVLSNNGWFTPSIEPTLQKILLQYYSLKYGTTIYHSVNMADAYMIKQGNVTRIGNNDYQ